MILKKPNLNQWLKKRCFTIIELLCVISIIAVLVCLLLPALSKAKKHAQGICCSNQLRQLWFSVNGYAEDNNEWIVPWRHKVNTTTVYWAHLLKDYLDLPRQSANTPRTILRCPSESYDLSGVGWTTWTPTSYGVNGNTWKSDTEPRWRRGDLKEPSKYSIFIDVAKSQVSYWNTAFIDYRHSNGANVLFLDGHTEHKGFMDLQSTSGSFYDGTP